MSLLGKWCWRLREEKCCLWYRVFAGRYGVKRGSLGGGTSFSVVE